jgi:hypothetical protein
VIPTFRRRQSPIAHLLLVAVLLVQSAATAAMPLRMALQAVQATAMATAADASREAQAMPADMACCDGHDPMPAPASATAQCSCDCSLLTSIQLPSAPLPRDDIPLPAIRLPADVAAWALTRHESPPLRPPISANT